MTQLKQTKPRWGKQAPKGRTFPRPKKSKVRTAPTSWEKVEFETGQLEIGKAVTIRDEAKTLLRKAREGQIAR